MIQAAIKGCLNNLSDFISTGEDYGEVNLHPAQAPYQDEPLAVPGHPRVVYEEDTDGIPQETLESSYEKQVGVDIW